MNAWHSSGTGLSFVEHLVLQHHSFNDSGLVQTVRLDVTHTVVTLSARLP
jgi:hypothetical protein